MLVTDEILYHRFNQVTFRHVCRLPSSLFDESSGPHLAPTKVHLSTNGGSLNNQSIYTRALPFNYGRVYYISLLIGSALAQYVWLSEASDTAIK